MLGLFQTEQFNKPIGSYCHWNKANGYSLAHLNISRWLLSRLTSLVFLSFGEDELTLLMLFAGDSLLQQWEAKAVLLLLQGLMYRLTHSNYSRIDEHDCGEFYAPAL